MKIRFLATAAPDLLWFKTYYMRRFPEGRRNADTQFLKVKALLVANPFLGHPVENVDGARAYPVSRTPFSFIYRVKGDTIEVLRVLDGRSADSSEYT